MSKKVKDFRYTHAARDTLSHAKTEIKPQYESAEAEKLALQKAQTELSMMQELLYAQNEWAVLIILQGMDTSGKDGLIRHVMNGVNPQGCSVASFKKPTVHELDHDFLWRCHREIPERGKIGVFNRSYYEDIVVPMVHPEILETSQIPPSLRQGKRFYEHRCEAIVQFEKYLARQGVLVLKIFLHISKKEQKKRLLSRLEEPDKNWKFEEGDLIERKHWNKYQKAYSFCFQHTSHAHGPWHILPADNKLQARVLASQIIIKAIAELNLKFPKVEPAKKKAIAGYRQKLLNEA